VCSERNNRTPPTPGKEKQHSPPCTQPQNTKKKKKKNNEQPITAPTSPCTHRRIVQNNKEFLSHERKIKRNDPHHNYPLNLLPKENYHTDKKGEKRKNTFRTRDLQRSGWPKKSYKKTLDHAEPQPPQASEQQLTLPSLHRFDPDKNKREEEGDAQDTAATATNTGESQASRERLQKRKRNFAMEALARCGSCSRHRCPELAELASPPGRV
jgi:hypothetical protein